MMNLVNVLVEERCVKKSVGEGEHDILQKVHEVVLPEDSPGTRQVFQSIGCR